MITYPLSGIALDLNLKEILLKKVCETQHFFRLGLRKFLQHSLEEKYILF
jgi:hypothetical protein